VALLPADTVYTTSHTLLNSGVAVWLILLRKYGWKWQLSLLIAMSVYPVPQGWWCSRQRLLCQHAQRVKRIRNTAIVACNRHVTWTRNKPLRSRVICYCSITDSILTNTQALQHPNTVFFLTWRISGCQQYYMEFKTQVLGSAYQGSNLPSGLNLVKLFPQFLSFHISNITLVLFSLFGLLQ
jgi:hypothetical protein